MTVLQTIAVAFAMFSALPVPQFEWNEKNMRYAMCAFPLIGLVCGGLWCLCGVLPLPELARAAAFCLVPVAVTGGMPTEANVTSALVTVGTGAFSTEDGGAGNTESEEITPPAGGRPARVSWRELVPSE